MSAEDAARLNAIASVATHVEDTIALVEQPAVAHDAPATLELAEGDQATYGVWLATQPTGTVTVAVSVAGDGVTATPSSLTFTRDAWNTKQTVTVAAAR